jgi:hypothetical protein
LSKNLNYLIDNFYRSRLSAIKSLGKRKKSELRPHLPIWE